MKIKRSGKALGLLLSTFVLTACLLPGMIPLSSATATAGPMPAMETSADKVIATLQTGGYVRLETLAQEQYAEQEYAKPGTLTFTVNLTDTKPTYFSWAWCAVDQQTLQQNFGHIRVQLYFNGETLGSDVAHSLSFTSANNMVCGEVGALLSDWPAGKYELKAMATFDQKINDGLADYEPGDYVFEYHVAVEK